MTLPDFRSQALCAPGITQVGHHRDLFLKVGFVVQFCTHLVGNLS